jgi:hypothetical protein
MKLDDFLAPAEDVSLDLTNTWTPQQSFWDREVERLSSGPMLNLTSRKSKGVLPERVPAGTRVAFTQALSGVLQYPNLPQQHGTVLLVRVGGVDSTSHRGRVMVSWDDGFFQPMLREHLRVAPSQRQANQMRQYCSLEDLQGTFTQAKNATDLVHKATKDLWSFRQEDTGYVIERLFDASGGPLKNT